MERSTSHMPAPHSDAAIIGLFGNLSWEEGWKLVRDTGGKGDVGRLIKKANAQIAAADTEEKVRELILTYEEVLEIDPGNYEALWSLGRYYMLLGIGYSGGKREMEECFFRAIRYCERGMYTNSEFKKLVDGGTKEWDAVAALTVREIAAMYYWYGALGNIYRICMNPVEKIINMRWVGRNKKMLLRMMEIDPAWGGGHPYQAIASYYAVLPRVLGGDLKKAAYYFQKADEAGPDWLYVRFWRAVVLHRKTGDREAFIKDLQWVIAQDPRKARSPYPWNVFFQREAKKMLEEKW